MTPNLLAYRSLVSRDAVKLVERLIDEQRILTRAIDRVGAAEASYAHRDAAEEALYRYIHRVEAERRTRRPLARVTGAQNEPNPKTSRRFPSHDREIP